MERNEQSLNSTLPQSRPVAAQEGTEVNLMDLLRVALKHWPYIAGCVVCALVVAYIYVHRTAPMYQRVATVLIKDKDSGNRTPSEAQLFKEVGLMNLGSNVENEILIFQSQYLAETVVRQLNLDVRYQMEGFWRKLDLYGISPVTVQFIEGADLACSFKLRLIPEKRVELYGIRYKNEDLEFRKVFALGDSVATPVGALRVLPTAFLTDFDASREILVSKVPVTLMASSLSGRIWAGKLSKEASMIQLSIQDEVPQRAEDILNTLMEAYKADIVQDKNTVARNTERFVVERLAVLEKELGQVDSKIASFRSENLLLDAAQSGVYLQKADQYQNEAVQLQTEMELTKYLKSYILQPKHDGELIPMNTGVTETNLNSLVGEYNKLRLQCDKLEGQSADNPVVLDLQQSMKALRGSILRTLDNHIKGLQVRMASTQKQEARSQNRASDIPNQQKIVLSVERQQKVKEQLYVYLLQKREENALAEYIAESNARVVDHAKGSSAPIAPKTQMVYLAALVLGLGIPTSILFLMLITDTKIRNRKAIEGKLSLPFLGDIPYKRGNDSILAVSVDGVDSVTESFRMLRTNLSFMKEDGHPVRVLMTTSMNEGAGKTFVGSNLAAMMAFAGKRVLMVDLDIRKASLTRLFGGKRQKGVTHYLIGQVEQVEELIHPVSGCPGLDIIYSGAIPPNPAELLLSDKLDELIGAVKDRYDLVLLDGVPTGVVADAAIVARLTDLTLFVARAGVLDRRQLPDIEQIYQSGKLKKMAVVLNSVKEEQLGYGHYGYAGYGYGYGYGNNQKKKKFLGLF
jgi:capsular exopolysaccharide synthesis family protein